MRLPNPFEDEAARTADAHKYDVRRERVVEQLAHIAFSDIRKLFQPNGTVKAISELDAGTAAGVVRYEVRETHFVYQTNGSLREIEPVDVELSQATLVRRTIKLRMADKRPALDLLSRVMGYDKQDEEAAERDTLRAFLEEIASSRSTVQPALHPDDDDDE